MADVSAALEAAAYLALASMMAAGAVPLARSGVRHLRAASRLRGKPLLDGIDNSMLAVSGGEPWPTSGRWPGPEHHREEFFDERRRAVYRSMAMDRAMTLSLASEITLLCSAAYLGFALPRALSRLSDLPGPGSPTPVEALPAPGGSALSLFSAVWPVAATLAFVLVALVLRVRSSRLRRLARMYLDPGDVAERPVLWVPPGARDRPPRDR